ncbi:MAG: ROK family protein [Bacilli bacterium]|jgi:glucokinase|nr:ROK family protein [Bacilli bacterium]
MHIPNDDSGEAIMISLGVDIGGTSIKGASINEDGQIIARFSLPIIAKETGKETLEKLGEKILSFINENNIQKKEILGLGVGCPGAINSEKGVIDYSNNLSWSNVPLKEILEKATNLKVKVINDANAAALGEAIFGAGKEASSVILLTLGTGVGGGIIINGQVYEGNEGKGAELGHTVIEIDGRLCTCGRRGCLEAYASATALISDTKEMLEKNRDSLMWILVHDNINEVNGATPFNGKLKGDKYAEEIIDSYIKYLGEGVLNFCNIFRPETVVLSGGIAQQGKDLLDPLIDYCEKRDYGFKGTPKVKITTAQLGYDSGIFGAASLFFNKK